MTTEEELERVRTTLRDGIQKGFTPPIEFTWVTRKRHEDPGSRLPLLSSRMTKEDHGAWLRPTGTSPTKGEWRQPSARAKSDSERCSRVRLDAICLVDPVSGRILNANPFSSELLSKPLEDIIGMHYSEFHPPGIRERAQESFKAHVEDRGPGQPIETALLTADGKEVPVELLAQIIQVDGVPVLMGTFRDITQRKASEEALRHSEERYRLLIQSSSDITALFDENGTIRYVSPAIERILGYQPEELSGQPATAILHPEDSAHHENGS